ncbi:MAG: protein-glutamate O-methyltransferase CheR [Thermodesulfobacteriota bacterium]
MTTEIEKKDIFGGILQQGASLHMSDDEFRLLRNLVYEECGIWLKDEKKFFLQNRAFQRMKALNLKSCYRYYKQINDPVSGKEELLIFLDALTINETCFFRNRPQLDLFSAHVVSDLAARKREKLDFNIKIWSAGCSTGQEPYTIGMILHEQILDLRQWRITILASDLSMTALETAQRGVYPIEKLDGIEERLIDRYFKKTPEGYRVIDEIKKHIVFDFHNLMHEGGYKDFDAVFCRNVLIYFDDETQKKVIDKFYRALVPQGYLVLGHAETLQGRNDNFIFIHKNKGTVYQKK